MDCHNLFGRQCDRDKHRQEVHGERLHKCGICEKAFVYDKDLQRHFQLVHKVEEYGVDPAASPSTSPHVNVHPYEEQKIRNFFVDEAAGPPNNPLVNARQHEHTSNSLKGRRF
jgi:hypothetical protein